MLRRLDKDLILSWLNRGDVVVGILKKISKSREHWMFFDGIFIYTGWNIWLHGNDRIFNNSFYSLVTIVLLLSFTLLGCRTLKDEKK